MSDAQVDMARASTYDEPPAPIAERSRMILLVGKIEAPWPALPPPATKTGGKAKRGKR